MTDPFDEQRKSLVEVDVLDALSEARAPAPLLKRLVFMQLDEFTHILYHVLVRDLSPAGAVGVSPRVTAASGARVRQQRSGARV